jgi:hypothetical protein
MRIEAFTSVTESEWSSRFIIYYQNETTALNIFETCLEKTLFNITSFQAWCSKNVPFSSHSIKPTVDYMVYEIGRFQQRCMLRNVISSSSRNNS